jgi:SAM-dependent methyltransferase
MSSQTAPSGHPDNVYAPTHAERSRQDFVLGLKLLANGPVQQGVREHYRKVLLPQLSERLGREPRTRPDVERAIARSDEFRLWAVLTHRTQTMMWDAIEATTRRVAGEGAARMQRLRVAARCAGSLQLDPALHVPPPIGNTEIHRQPGGFVGPADPDDVTPGLRYFGASLIYSAGKGQTGAAGDGRASALLEQLRARFPALQTPRRILDLGCGIGVHAQAIAREFPQAEYHGVDVAAGLLKFGHLLAEERGVPIHFHQRDAAQTGFPAASFDLVLSNILFHETNAARLPQILRECRRVLRPGGAMLHVDVPTQVTRQPLVDQVMNDWQVRWNGEPFWTAFAERDMRAEIIAAGFEPERTFAAHETRPGGTWYVFGAAG